MYYDHWEDGFETDVTAPTQTTHRGLGRRQHRQRRRRPERICGAVCAGDLLPAGAVFVLRNDLPTPRSNDAIRFDGGDRVLSTRGFTITAGGFTKPLGLGAVGFGIGLRHDEMGFGLLDPDRART